MVNGTKQNPPPYPHAKKLLAVEWFASLATFYQSPGAYIAFSANKVLTKILAPFIPHSPLLQKLLSNIAVFGAELTDYGPYTMGKEQMEKLLAQHGSYAYAVPTATFLLWNILPQAAQAAMGSSLGQAAQDFSELMWLLEEEDNEPAQQAQPSSVQISQLTLNVPVVVPSIRISQLEPANEPAQQAQPSVQISQLTLNVPDVVPSIGISQLEPAKEKAPAKETEHWVVRMRKNAQPY